MEQAVGQGGHWPRQGQLSVLSGTGEGQMLNCRNLQTSHCFSFQQPVSAAAYSGNPAENCQLLLAVVAVLLLVVVAVLQLLAAVQ